MKKCYLVLADGHIFEGKRFGAEGSALGELVFNTGMVGYEATLTDPNNYGQIVLQTFPMIGNYGIIPADLEGKKAHLSGYVVREYCTAPSNFRCEGTLDEYLKAQGIVGICDLDTREITRILRDKGVMNAKIVDDPAAKLYPMPVEAAEQYDIQVGRIRQDISRNDKKGLDIFVSGDQVLKGAALNAVQIAELL